MGCLEALQPKDRWMISIFLVSDFELLKHGLQTLLSSKPEQYRFDGCATHLDTEALPWGEISPDVLLLDLEIREGDVVAWLEHWHKKIRTKVLLLTLREESPLAERAMLAGARGLMDCRGSVRLLLDAIEKIHLGEVWLDHKTTGRLWSRLTTLNLNDHHGNHLGPHIALTPREQKILVCLVKLSGDPARTIAEKLNMSESTLRNYLTSIYNKCGVANRSGLLAFVLKNGLAKQLGAE